VSVLRPLDWLPADLWWPLLIALAVCAYLAMRAFGPSGRAMRATGGPGIVPFELAGADVVGILDTWGEPGRAAARENLRLDRAFVPLYSTFLALLIAMSAVRVAERTSSWTAVLTTVVAVLALVMGVADLLENWQLGRALDAYGEGDRAEASAAGRQAASWARIKFALLAVVLLYGALVATILIAHANGP
jgi:hypothetical protein